VARQVRVGFKTLLVGSGQHEIRHPGNTAYWITRSSAQLRTRRVMITACVAKWHSKFHAATRGIEATPLKKWMIR
jgi:hypothetical protein